MEVDRGNMGMSLATGEFLAGFVLLALDLENHTDRCAARMALIANLPVVDEGGRFAGLQFVLSHEQVNLGAELSLFDDGLSAT